MSSKTIERGLEILDEHGWIQGRTGDEESGYCISGALYRASNEQSPWESGGREIFEESLRPIQSQLEYPNVAVWNDDPSRTFSQVREVFQRAAVEGALAGDRVGQVSGD